MFYYAIISFLIAAAIGAVAWLASGVETQYALLAIVPALILGVMFVLLGLREDNSNADQRPPGAQTDTVRPARTPKA